jgi:hypothetical protein
MARKLNAEQIAQAQARRADLAARSKPIQRARKMGVFPWSLLPTVNACLELIYSQETGQTDWATFRGWKERGFSVCKGEKGFAIWGRPRRATASAEGFEQVGGDSEQGDPKDGESFEWFPISYLFHAGQVANANGERPSANIVAIALSQARRAPLALPEFAEATRTETVAA